MDEQSPCSHLATFVKVERDIVDRLRDISVAIHDDARKIGSVDFCYGGLGGIPHWDMIDQSYDKP